jgi:hypothetical protein
MNYSFHPAAEKELEEIENYYDSIRDELGDRFRAETEMAISRILDFHTPGNGYLKTLAAVH